MLGMTSSVGILGIEYSFPGTQPGIGGGVAKTWIIWSSLVV